MLRYVQLFVSGTACVRLISCCIYTAPVSQSSSRPGDACAARAATPHRFRTPLLHLSAPPPTAAAVPRHGTGRHQPDPGSTIAKSKCRRSDSDLGESFLKFTG